MVRIPPEDTEYGRCEAYSRTAERRCKRAAIGEHGKCGFHGGKSAGGGAPSGNSSAKTHGLYMATDTYLDKQSDDDQEWIRDLRESLVDMWRRRHGDKPPRAIRERLESIAIDCHRVSHANAYMADEGLTQIRQEVVGDEKITTERLTLWAAELRRYNSAIENRLDKHGLLDPPEDRGESSHPEDGDVMRSEDYVITVNRENNPAEDGDDGE